MSSQERSRLVRRTILTHDDKRWLRALPRGRTQDGACPNRRSPERSTSRSRANGVQTPSGSRPIIVFAFLKGYPCAGRGSPSAPPAGTIGRWRRVPGTRFPVSVIIVGVPGLSGVASKMSTRSLPSSASPVGGRPMTDDQLILLAVLPIFRASTEGDRAPSSRTDRPGRGRWNSRDGVFFVGESCSEVVRH